MNTPPARLQSLSSRIAASGAADRWLWDGDREVSIASALLETRLGVRPETLHDQSVLLRTEDQLTTALALIELDGVARRLVLCPPDLDARHLGPILQEAEVKAVLGDLGTDAGPALSKIPVAQVGLDRTPLRPDPDRRAAVCTEWVLFTSGTTGRPKMVVHTLDGLIGAIPPYDPAERPVWGTFYDIRRYGGLQMFLRACLGGASMVLSRPGERVASFLGRLAHRGATHVSGTPSHWRAALMSPQIAALRPRYVRLSGEIADQAVLDRLRQAFPGVPIAHAYASTEAGVGFEVTDGLAGFPERYLDQRPPAVEIKVIDGSLRLRSSRTAERYLDASGGPLRDQDGFVDTGDMVERRDGRVYFVGRRGGIINVGGLKLHPEEVEAVINAVPGVRMSLVRARKNALTGAVVAADVVAEPGESETSLRAAILAAARSALPAHKIPATLRFVETLSLTTGGKLERAHA